MPKFGEINARRLQGVQQGLSGVRQSFASQRQGLGDVNNQRLQLRASQQREEALEEQRKQANLDRLMQIVNTGVGVATPFIQHGLREQSADAQAVRDQDQAKFQFKLDTKAAEAQQLRDQDFEEWKLQNSLDFKTSPQYQKYLDGEHARSQRELEAKLKLEGGFEEAQAEANFRRDKELIELRNRLAQQERMGVPPDAEMINLTLHGIEMHAFGERSGIYNRYYQMNPQTGAQEANLDSVTTATAVGPDGQKLTGQQRYTMWREKVLDEGKPYLQSAFDAFVGSSEYWKQFPGQSEALKQQLFMQLGAGVVLPEQATAARTSGRSLGEIADSVRWKPKPMFGEGQPALSAVEGAASGLASGIAGEIGRLPQRIGEAFSWDLGIAGAQPEATPPAALPDPSIEALRRAQVDPRLLDRRLGQALRRNR